MQRCHREESETVRGCWVGVVLGRVWHNFAFMPGLQRLRDGLLCKPFGSPKNEEL